MRILQYKILNNVLYLNKLLYKMKILESPFCYFCREQNETPIYLFCKCKVTLDYWSSLQAWLRSILNLPDLTPESALLGKLDFDTTGTNTRSILVSHIMNHYTRVHNCRIMGFILYAFHEPSISLVLLSHSSIELFTTT